MEYVSGKPLSALSLGIDQYYLQYLSVVPL